MKIDKKKAAIVAALAAAIAMPAESLRQKAYADPIGLATICWGSTKGVKLGDYATLEQCKARLDSDMTLAVEQVASCAPDAPIRVLAAFSDAVFNMGPTIACDTSKSTAARKLKAKDWDGACKELPRWDKARVAGVMVTLPGLTKRRNKEMDLCLSGEI